VLIAVLAHILLIHFQFVLHLHLQVDVIGPLLLNACLLLLTTDYSGSAGH